MASSIFGSAFGNSSWDGTTLSVAGAINATTGPITIGGTAGMSVSASNLLLKPVDTGAYLIVNNGGQGVDVNSCPLRFLNAGVVQSRLAIPAVDTINFTNAAGTGAATIQIGGAATATSFGPSAVASLTVSHGFVTAAS